MIEPNNMLDRFIAFMITIMLMVLVGISFASVFARFVLQSSLVWADEFMRYLFIWIVFFAGVLLVIEKSHIAVDLTSLILPKRYVEKAYIVGYVISAVFLGFLLFFSIRIIFMNFTRVSPAMEIPLGYVYMCIPVGVSFSILAYIRLIWLYLRQTHSSGGR